MQAKLLYRQRSILIRSGVPKISQKNRKRTTTTARR
jgi:hypothetical protein